MYQLRHRLKSFGMTIEDYEKLIVKQKGCCALCGLRTRALVIDHCHDSGRVRGLLCKNCNVALGHFKDEPAVLRKAIKYLS